MRERDSCEKERRRAVRKGGEKTMIPLSPRETAAVGKYKKIKKRKKTLFAMNEYQRLERNKPDQI